MTWQIDSRTSVQYVEERKITHNIVHSSNNQYTLHNLIHNFTKQ